MRRFQYHVPESLPEASRLLHELGDAASLFAGGTDLLVEIREELRVCAHVIDIKKIRGLRELSFDDARGLRIGAQTTARDIETSPVVRAKYPNLASAAAALGSIQVRNRATLVGNICRASPSADTLPPLIADGAVLTIWSEEGERSAPVERFFVGPGKTVLARGEIVTGVTIPPPRPASARIYIKHGRRKAMELATVGVAVSVERDDDVCGDIRIALGAVAPTPIRAIRAEAALRGNRITPSLIAEAAEAAILESTPISNVRASAGYRREMVGVLTRRAIEAVTGALQ